MPPKRSSCAETRPVREHPHRCPAGSGTLSDRCNRCRLHVRTGPAFPAQPQPGPLEGVDHWPVRGQELNSFAGNRCPPGGAPLLIRSVDTVFLYRQVGLHGDRTMDDVPGPHAPREAPGKPHDDQTLDARGQERSRTGRRPHLADARDTSQHWQATGQLADSESHAKRAEALARSSPQGAQLAWDRREHAHPRAMCSCLHAPHSAWNPSPQRANLLPRLPAAPPIGIGCGGPLPAPESNIPS